VKNKQGKGVAIDGDLRKWDFCVRYRKTVFLKELDNSMLSIIYSYRLMKTN